MMPHISFYTHLRRPDSRATIKLDDWLAGIALGRWKLDVELVRQIYQAHGKTDEYTRRKSLLPAATPAGMFEYRNNARLIQSSGIVHGDIDDLDPDRLTQIFNLIVCDPLVCYCFKSPSGNGLKLGLLIPKVCNDVEYKLHFYRMESYIKRSYEVVLDPSGKDICRACYVSHDPDIYYSPHCEVFRETAEPPVQKSDIHAPIATPIPVPIPQHITDVPADSQQLQWALTQLQNAPLGTRHATRLKIGQLVGGWISGCQLAPEAADILSDTAAAHSDHPGQARRDISNGLGYGAARPLFPENKAFDTLARRARSRGRYFRG